MENKKIIRIGSVELYEDSAIAYAQENKCICAGKRIFKVMYDSKRGVYGKVIYSSKESMTLRGRFHVFSEEYVRANWNCK